MNALTYSPQNHHCPVPFSSAVYSAESAEKRHKIHCSTVQGVLAGETFLEAPPHVLNNVSRPLIPGSTVPAASNTFSPPEGTILRQNSPKNSPSSSSHFCPPSTISPAACILSLQNPLLRQVSNEFSFPLPSPNQIPNLINIHQNTTSGIPDSHISQISPTVSQNQNSVLPIGHSNLSAQYTVTEALQTVPAAPTFSVPAATQGSMPEHSFSNTLPIPSPISSQPFASTRNDSTTIPITSQPSSSISNKQTFANLFNQTKSSPPIPLAPLPVPYIKGNLPAIKLDEEVYQKSVLACQLNLIGRISLPKGECKSLRKLQEAQVIDRSKAAICISKQGNAQDQSTKKPKSAVNHQFEKKAHHPIVDNTAPQLSVDKSADPVNLASSSNHDCAVPPSVLQKSTLPMEKTNYTVASHSVSISPPISVNTAINNAFGTPSPIHYHPQPSQDTPLGESSHVAKQPSQSINNKTTEGSEYVPSPLKTRAQRQKKGQPLSLTKQLKAKKAVNRELKAYSIRSKSTAQPQTSDPDAFQWQLYEKEEKMREDETAAAKSNDEQHQWKVCVYAKSPIVTAGASGTISSPLHAENITIAHEEKAK
ncbi:hypothetical protein LguiA_001989 [Lonicera macranthoides]